MAVDVFLKIDSVKGEATDREKKDWIDVLDWEWGMSQSGTFHMVGPGGGGGKASFQDMSISKYVDLSSNELMKSCAMGKHFQKATLVCRKSTGDKPMEYFVVEMEKVLVSSYTTGGSKDNLDRVREKVTLNFGKFTITYKSQTETGGAGPEGKIVYNIAETAEG